MDVVCVWVYGTVVCEGGCALCVAVMWQAVVSLCQGHVVGEGAGVGPPVEV